ncbi:S-linalool synthase-like, partial [Dendrobium catenatum]|uniref:S-linalool synthase-like n=1 Tax=Dendrobium catenatum TaxID=906689 RepID=UPI0010A01358
MFPKYLEWVLCNQNDLGFWFDEQHELQLDHHELINYKHQWSGEDLLATLVCLIALKTWEITGFSYKINKGIKFLQDNLENELMNMRKSIEGGDEDGLALLHRWFLMVELARAKGLKVFPDQQITNEIFHEFKLKGTKLKREENDEIITEERVVMREIAFENSNSSLLFQSPSTAACTYNELNRRPKVTNLTFSTCLPLPNVV